MTKRIMNIEDIEYILPLIVCASNEHLYSPTAENTIQYKAIKKLIDSMVLPMLSQ